MPVPKVIGIALSAVILLCATTGTNGGYFQTEFFENVANHLNESSEAIVFNRIVPAIRSYDDELCVKQFSEFLGALRNMNFWAIRGI